MSADSRNALFSVLCLHSYESREESGLSFRKNEILQILETQDSGWWAARRKGDKDIGWIPRAYVAKLEDDWVDRFEEMREEIRCSHFNAEKLYSEAPTSMLGMLGPDVEPITISRSSSLNATIPKQVSKPLPSRPISSAQCREPLRPITPAASPGQRPSPVQRPQLPQIPQPPPSPSNPMPLPPPPQTAPLYNKPVPPLPTEANRPRAGSENRARRQQVILADSATRVDLTTLIEGASTNDFQRYPSPDIIRRPSTRARGTTSMLRGGSDYHSPHRNKPTKYLEKHAKILDKPWYILPEHAKELDVDEDGTVRGGSLLALVEHLTSEEAFKDRNRSGSSFASAFLMTFRTFTTSEKLFDMLLDRFSMTRPDNLLEIEVEDWKKRFLQKTQRHVLAVFSLWLEDYRMLEDDRHIAQRLPDFVTQVAMPRLQPESQALMQAFERLTFSVPMGSQMAMSPKKSRKKPLKNDLLRLDSSELAEQLTLYEQQRYTKIVPRECLAYMHTQLGPTVFHLEAFCRTYDQLANWVKLSILEASSIPARTNTVDYWIKVAEKCRVLNNFSSMSAILSALSSTAVTRLSASWAEVKRKSQLEGMAKYNLPTGGFSGYRTLLANVEDSSPCVPFITMYLTDIMRIREQYKDDLPTRICFTQRQRWHDTIAAMLKFQRRQYVIAPDPNLQLFLEAHLREGGLRVASWFWERSEYVQETESNQTSTSVNSIGKALLQTGF